MNSKELKAQLAAQGDEIASTTKLVNAMYDTLIELKDTVEYAERDRQYKNEEQERAEKRKERKSRERGIWIDGAVSGAVVGFFVAALIFTVWS